MKSKAHYQEISLYLNDIHELFSATEVDLSGRNLVFGSGIDSVINALRPTSLVRLTRLTIFLPEEKLASLSNGQVKAAVEQYCRFKQHEIDNNLRALRWEGFKALQTGCVWLIICLSLSFFFRQALFLPEFFQNVLGEGFLIAGWVGIWRPTELFLYDWWPHWRESHIFENMAKLEIVIRGQAEN